jgi:ribosomal protein L29
MSGLIDTTLDELDRQVRELERELAALRALRRDLSPSVDHRLRASRSARSERG